MSSFIYTSDEDDMIVNDSMRDPNSSSDEEQGTDFRDHMDYSHIITRISTKTYRFKWTMNQFSKLRSGTDVLSPEIRPVPEVTWKVKLRKDEMRVKIFLRSMSGRKVGVECDLTVKDCNGRECCRKSTRQFTIDKRETKTIANYADDFNNLKNDILVFDCVLKVTRKPTSMIRNYQFETDEKEKLTLDLKQMFEDSLNTDVTLRIDAEHSMRAHWCILCARCPYFRKVFDSNMEERERNEIMISDIEFSALKKLVHFLYTGSLCFEDEDALESVYAVYYAADKYTVLDLRKMCGNKMLSKVTVDNAIQVLLWADLHSDEDLKTQVMGFIRFHLDCVLHTEAWVTLVETKPKVTLSVMSFCAQKLQRS